MRVYRTHPIAIAAGALLLIFGIWGAAQAVVRGAADLGWFLVASGLLIGGGAILAYAVFSRVEVDDAGIRFYDLTNRLSFKAQWNEIRGYRREPGSEKTDWTLETGGISKVIPIFGNGAALHADVLRRLDFHRIRVDGHRPAAGIPPNSENFVLRSSSDLMLMIFSIIWYGFLAVFSMATLVMPQGGDAPPPLLFPSLIIGFAAIMFPAAQPSWSRYLYGTASMDRHGARLRLPEGETEVLWSDLILVENRVDSDSESTTQTLVLIGRTFAVQYDSRWPGAEALRQFALACAPADCLFAGFS